MLSAKVSNFKLATENLLSVGAYVRVWGGEEVVEASRGGGGSRRGRRGEDRRGWVFSSLRIERTWVTGHQWLSTPCINIVKSRVLLECVECVANPLWKVKPYILSS